MRLIARTVAAVVAIILGLALVGAAAFSSGAEVVGRPAVPDVTPSVGTIKPINPESRNQSEDPAKPQQPVTTPDVFSGEFGERGTHQVTVSTSGGIAYKVSWRDGKVDQSTGSLRQTRTVRGGFPLVQVVIQNFHGGTSSCTITIDGIQKDHQTTDRQNPIVTCQA